MHFIHSIIIGHKLLLTSNNHRLIGDHWHLLQAFIIKVDRTYTKAGNNISLVVVKFGHSFEMLSSAEQMTIATQWSIVIGASLVAAVSDLRTRRIPNTLTIPLLIAGLVWAGWTNGLLGIANAAGACLWLALPFLLLFVFVGGGAGDAKLMGAIGVWLGLSQGTIVLVCVMIAGIILSLCKAAIHKKLKLVLMNVFISVYTFIICALGRRTKQLTVNRNGCVVNADALTIPYATAIFAGVCIAGSLRLI